MILLLDQNLSHRLLSDLEPLFAGSTHVRSIGLATASDEEIWNVARDQEFTIVTHDADFYERELILGHPPKVIWITTGNTSTRNVRDILLRHAVDIDRFDRDDTLGCLQLY